jgi:hypothetical protein
MREVSKSGRTVQDVSEAEIHIKGEIHSSRGDYEEERKLMKEGVDALVLEGEESQGEYTMTEGWFQQAKTGMFYILSPLYVSKEIFVDFAELQEANVYFTRDSDAEVLRNAPFLVRAISAALYYLLLPTSVVVGLLTGDYVTGAGFLAISFIVPVLLLRWYNMRFQSKEKNRDQLMAEKITEAAEGNGSVLAVVGEGHTEGVLDALTDELDVTHHPPKYSRASREHLRDIAIPVFQMFSLLFTLYVFVVWGSTLLLGLV